MKITKKLLSQDVQEAATLVALEIAVILVDMKDCPKMTTKVEHATNTFWRSHSMEIKNDKRAKELLIKAEQVLLNKIKNK